MCENVIFCLCITDTLLFQRMSEQLRRWADIECVEVTLRRCTALPGPGEDCALLFLDTDAIRAGETRPASLECPAVVIYRDQSDIIPAYRWGPSALLNAESDENELAAVMESCAETWERGRLWLELEYARKTLRVPAGEIRYVEASHNDCVLVCGNKTIRARWTLNGLEKLLEGALFARCHRSYLVRLPEVEALTGGRVVLRGGETLPVSRSCGPSFREALESWREKRDI